MKERSFSWTRTLYLLVALVLVSLSLILLSQGRYLQPLESVAGQVFNPIQQAAHSVTSGVGDWLGSIGRGHDLAEENKQLRTTIERLTTDNTALKALESENEQLRALLKFQTDRPELTGVVAKSIGGDPTGQMEILTLDRGSKDGLAEGMAVVSTGGILIGQISAVKPERSTVLLITDVGSSLPVVTQRTQKPGVLTGQWQKGGRLLMQRIPRDADVVEGDMLLTSGVGGSLPDGLIVGVISKVLQGDVQMEKDAEASPLVELKSLESVLVIKNK
jgi:rod shape-determining protein MreC